jgi:hypothetical protein
MHNGEARPPCCETMLNASIVHIWHRYALAYCDMYKANLKSAARMRARALKLQCRLKSRGCPSCTPPGQRSCGHYKTAECRRITLSASYISDVDLSAYYLAEEPPDGPRPHGPCLASAVDSHIIRAKARLQAQHPFCTKIGVISNQSQTGRVCHCAYGHTVSLNFK